MVVKEKKPNGWNAKRSIAISNALACSAWNVVSHSGVVLEKKNQATSKSIHLSWARSLVM